MKKPKKIRRIAALLTAIVFMASMSVTVFAEDPSGTGRYGVYVTEDPTVTFRKEIVLKNNDASHVYSPDISYTYNIAPVAEADLKGATVTDSAGKSIQVRPGKTGGVTMNPDGDTANFTSERVELTNGTATISKNLTATIDLSKFNDSGAGIYRYVITETVNKTSLTAQGLSRGTDYKDTRYLDVYISNVSDETAANTLKVSGYVIFVAGSSGGVINSNDSTSDTITGKTEGFVDNTELSIGGAGPSSLADTYYTYNLTVKVDILGSLANEENLFPVSISTDGVAGRQFDYSVTVNKETKPYTGAAGAGIVDPGGQIGQIVATNLAKNDSITLYGLPANTRFNVTETNNTENTYDISVKSGEITLEGKSAVEVEKNETISAFDASYAGGDLKNISDYADYTTTNLTQSYSTLTFTNTLNDVSLTGIVLRIAPYAILLAAAMLLGIFYLNSRKKRAPKNVL